MSYLQGFLFAAALVTARSSAEECHDETSLLQVQANIALHDQTEAVDTSDESEVRLFFESAEDLKRSVLSGWQDCKDAADITNTFTDSGDDPACATKSTIQGQPCDACIKSSWSAKHKGAGNKCCQRMSAADIKQEPLCGICARFNADKAGGTGLSGTGDADMSVFFTSGCAAAFCAAATSPPNLAQIAAKCSPEKLKMTTRDGTALKLTDVPKCQVAVVANNPKKPDLAAFLAEAVEGRKTFASGKDVTGTATSTNLAKCVIETVHGTIKSSVSRTASGPSGGDAQLAGLLAADPKYFSGVIFIKDETEAHQLDILALKNIIDKTLSANQVSYTKAGAAAVLQTVAHGSCP